MIEAGDIAQITWADGNWIFLDIGFSSSRKSCGVIVGESEPLCLQFGQAQRDIVEKIMKSKSLINLVIEAPLSVCFSCEGNPKGRSIEKEDGKTRYWYNGLGCAVMMAAMYVVKRVYDAKPSVPVRLFEGFVSYKNRPTKSDHAGDVKLLRDAVRDPRLFRECLISADRLKHDACDQLVSAFNILGLNCGIPAVIKRAISN
jgi:hypothetical protein